MKLLIIILMIICIIICILKLKEKGKKNYIIITLLFVNLLIYIISSFGISFTPKTTYNMKNLYSSYNYKECFEIENNLMLIISEKTSDEEIEYNLTLQNRVIGLYIANEKKYSQGIMVTGDNELDVNYIVYENKYYYYFNSYEGIKEICIDNKLYDISKLQSYIYISNERIESLEINSQTYFPYYVQVEFNWDITLYQ